MEQMFLHLLLLLLLLLWGSSNTTLSLAFIFLYAQDISTRVFGDVSASAELADVLPEEFESIRESRINKKYRFTLVATLLQATSGTCFLYSGDFNVTSVVLPLLPEADVSGTFQCFHLSFTTDFVKG